MSALFHVNATFAAVNLEREIVSGLVASLVL
jgi:hypothetical protein